jgi:hypothetical protein
MNSIISPTLERKQTVFNGPKAGDIIVSNSGYEASIAHFARVVSVSGKSIKIERLRSINTYIGSSGMTWNSVPDLSSGSGNLETKRIKPVDHTYCVKDTSFCNFWPWNGKEVSCYNYH